MYGLLEKDLSYILDELSKFEEIEKAVIFGSRAMENYKKGLDIDLAIRGCKITDEHGIVKFTSEGIDEV